MEKVDVLKKQQFIFGIIFILANKLQVLGDRTLDGITMKQWLLTAIISQFQGDPPTLSEVSELMGSSHQNVKQLALKLREKGFLRIEKNPRDGRALRLILTEKSATFWKNRETEDLLFLSQLFADIKEDELHGMYQGMIKLHQEILSRLGEKDLMNREAVL